MFRPVLASTLPAGTESLAAGTESGRTPRWDAAGRWADLAGANFLR
ncbi:MAG: hypothetical protein MI861_28130 [Pirellulales bacterium]|nr:hypothetical protein [Pirellulales bacterium]